MYQRMPINQVIKNLERGTLVPDHVLKQYMVELQERRREICASCCSYIDGCCITPAGLLNADPWDYCSRWVEKKEVK